MEVGGLLQITIDGYIKKLPNLTIFEKNMASSSSLLISVLRILMILIFAGWILLWSLKPTDLWNKKWKQAERSAAKSIFSYNGLDFMAFSLPIIVLAMIGFIYLELIVTQTESQSESNSKPFRPFSALSNPVIINRLIGILTAGEALAVGLFLMFLAWTLYSRLSSDLHKTMPAKSLKLVGWQFVFFRAVIRSGLLAESCLVLLFLPILRTLAVFRFIGVQFEVSVRYHVWLGTAMVFFSAVHGGGTLFIWAINHIVQDQIWRWQRTGRIYLAGEIAMAIGLVIWVTSLPWFRRKKFEVFYFAHHLYVAFMIFYLFHVGDRRFYAVFPAVFLFTIDKLLRLVQSRPETFLLSARIFPCKAIELILPKDPKLKYTPTSIVFIKIPTISKFQWHCFSVSSSSMVDHRTMSVLIKVGGDWTNALYERIRAQIDNNCIPVFVEGPYGPASLPLLRYDRLLMIAGGSGITPFLSILQENVVDVQLIYVTKNLQDVTLLRPILIRKSANLSTKIRVFVTRELRANLTTREAMNELSRIECVSFSAGKFSVRGVKSSVWMAVIVGCSSVVFLVLICLFNATFAKGSDKPKITSTKVDAFLLCSFVAAVACGTAMGFLLRLRRTKNERVKMIKASRLDEIAVDALEENCEFYFTGRPRFEDVLSEFVKDSRGSDIGVLVSGPETMKESVASALRNFDSLISSGIKKPRIHFHSLTFSL